MKFIDSHAHLDFDDFHSDFDKVLERASSDGIKNIINIGADLGGSRSSIQLAERFSSIYATVGVHPEEETATEIDLIKRELELLVKSSPKVVGIGECGLDYFRSDDLTLIARQNELFKTQLLIAREHNLPAVIHIRNGDDGQAFHDAVAIIKEVGHYKGVVHCFTFGPDEAKILIDLGLYIGFTGIITYKNSSNIQEAAKMVPLEKILIETDCPFLSPQKYRGQRNEPAYVVEVAKKIAELRDTNLEEVALQTTNNVLKLFNIK